MTDILKETKTHYKGELKFVSLTWINKSKIASLSDKEATFKIPIFDEEDIKSAIKMLENNLTNQSS